MGSLPDRERNPARTRAAILDAAEKLFAGKGFDATSLNDVGTAAGVSRGTPGYFFGSKEELVRAVLVERMTTLAEQRHARLEPLLRLDEVPVRAVVVVMSRCP